MVVSTHFDVLYVDIKRKIEVDIDDLFHIADMKSVINYNKKFYILANKLCGTLGYFLLSIDENDPADSAQFLVNYKTKLEIGDAKMFLSETANKDLQLIISFKSIYINTFNVIVVDIKSERIKYRYECYHLWETSL